MISFFEKTVRSSCPGVFLKIDVANNVAKFTGLQTCNFIKKRLRHRCFPVSFAKVLRTPFYITPRGYCF